MAQSDARFGYRANLGRDDHNLSQPLGFTSAPGMLLPIWFDLATPGDSYYMQHDMPLLRSIQLVAPSMLDVKVHFETFFVPLQMIYQPAENTLFSLEPIQSSRFDYAQFLNNNFPTWDYSDIIYDCLNGAGTLSSERCDAFRLADLLGLCQMNFIDTTGMSNGVLEQYAPNIFPYQLLAYHTLFMYYYRLDDKDGFDNLYCNMDNQYGTAVAASGRFDRTFFKIHQRAWDFDYYTSMYRSPIVSDANMQKVLPASLYSPLDSQTGVIPRSPSGVGNPANSSVSNFATTNMIGVYQAPDSINTAIIRQMFANEKLAMITGRTKKNYDSQVLAHYGKHVPHDVKHDITMIKHDVYDLQVQEVTSLASTSDAPLGELAGKSYAAGNGKQFKFTAPCHGVMMTIFSIEPKKRYITGFDRINAVSTAFDLPTPEFDRLGNVPMFRYESNWQKGSTGYTNTDIIGWKERYYWNKRKMPKVTMAFYAANGINNFGAYFLNSTPFGQSSISSGTAISPVRSFPRPDQLNRFYIERGCLDNMCLVPFYDGFMAGGSTGEEENWNNTPWLLYSRDPFIVNSHIKCKKVSWMSKDGEPIYD